MKKILKAISLVLIFSVCTLLLVGCGEKTTTDNNDSGKTASNASDYPSKPIQIVVPLKAGGDTDYNARILAQYLEKYIGQTVVVTNVDGGGTVTGMQQVLDSDSSGYYIVVNGTDIFVPNMLGNTDINLDSFKTVGIPTLDNTTVLAVNAKSGWETLDDLVKASIANPGSIEYGMKIGAANNICGIAMTEEWGSQFKNVDVGNNAAKVTALLAGQTDVINVNYGVAKDYFESGEFIALCLLGEEANPNLDIPLPSDQGYTNIDFGKFFWLGMHPDTPDEVIEVVTKALEEVTKDPEYIEKMEANYLTVEYMNPTDAYDYSINLYEKYMLPYKEAFVSQ